MNKTFAVFANGGTMTTAQTALWQYDYGQILVVQGIELPTAYEVQFCNAGDSTTITSVGDSTGVVIPDQFLQNGETIYAYIYLHTGNADGETEYKITIPVMDRAEPTDIEPTPQQESTIGQLIDALNAGVEAAEEAAEKGPQIIDGYWFVWDAEAGEYVNTNVKAEGEDGADGNSVWWTVSLINDESMPGLVLGKIRSSWLKGRSGTPAAHDLVVGPAVGTSGSIEWLYEIIAVSGIYCNLKGIGSIKGAPGDPGDPGEPGFAPVVTIETITGGHRVTITSAAHPEGESFDVMNGSGGGADLFTATYTQSGGTVSCDKTYAEISAALSDKTPMFVFCAIGSAVGAVCVSTGFGANGKLIHVLTNHAGVFTVIEHSSSDAITMSSFDISPIAAISQGVTNPPTSGAVYDAIEVLVQAIADKYTLPTGGIPASDLASAVQTSLGKADTALQTAVTSFNGSTGAVTYTAPVTSVNSQTGAVSLSIPTTASDVGAVAVAQGVAHAGEFVVVGSDGNVTTMTLSTWQGGNYGS